MPLKIQTNCRFCGKIFFVSKYLHEKKDRGNYCSRSCATKWRIHFGELGIYLRSMEQRKHLNCKYCGEEFFVQKKLLRSGKHKGLFCSRRCSLLDRPPTSIEQIISDYLDELGVKHIRQYPVKSGRKGSKFRYVDEFLPDYGICIEINGNYWHTNKKAMFRDMRKSNIIRSNGYKLLVVWGSDIHNNWENTKWHIKDFIRVNGGKFD